ncbi:uncharacterized protein LOC143876132 isoform X1 [Tasmannia lanceolata]|uniref:uncharacterized protein LOC143876132 isoform X1 n=1 Tax=Tasmannia lanceolata TaxID=3420 RepID=UPI00406428BF
MFLMHFVLFMLRLLHNISAPLHYFRTDNAREYLSNEFNTFLSSHGIIHQSSCAHTSHQNGVAERKLRYLLDITCSLLFQMHVPKSYWSDAVLIACFLANRLPSSVLDGSSPYSILHPTSDPFPLTPQVFSCVCFVHNLSPGLDKLDPWAERRVFLGYSRTQKGYRCYNPKLRCLFISADVTFFESTPFFQPPTVWDGLSDSPVPLPLPVLPDLVPSTPPTLPSPTPPPSIPPPPITRIYQRRQRDVALALPPGLPSSQPEIPISSSQVPLLPSSDKLVDSSIASRTRSRTTAHPSSYVVSYDHLTLFRSFVSSLSSVSLPRSVSDALAHPGWRAAMEFEMAVLRSNHT